MAAGLANFLLSHDVLAAGAHAANSDSVSARIPPARSVFNSPVFRPVQRSGNIKSEPILGGLHHSRRINNFKLSDNRAARKRKKAITIMPSE
jgi:hypothetical protein